MRPRELGLLRELVIESGRAVGGFARAFNLSPSLLQQLAQQA